MNVSIWYHNRFNDEKPRGGGNLLTGAELGGRTLPVSVTVQPLGKPGYVVGTDLVVWKVTGLAAHGTTLPAPPFP